MLPFCATSSVPLTERMPSIVRGMAAPIRTTTRITGRIGANFRPSSNSVRRVPACSNMRQTIQPRVKSAANGIGQATRHSVHGPIMSPTKVATGGTYTRTGVSSITPSNSCAARLRLTRKIRKGTPNTYAASIGGDRIRDGCMM